MRNGERIGKTVNTKGDLWIGKLEQLLEIIYNTNEMVNDNICEKKKGFQHWWKVSVDKKKGQWKSWSIVTTFYIAYSAALNKEE